MTIRHLHIDSCTTQQLLVSAFLSVCLYDFLSVCLSVYRSFRPSVCMSVSLWSMFSYVDTGIWFFLNFFLNNTFYELWHLQSIIAEVKPYFVVFLEKMYFWKVKFILSSQRGWGFHKPSLLQVEYISSLAIFSYSGCLHVYLMRLPTEFMFPCKTIPSNVILGHSLQKIIRSCQIIWTSK